MYLAKLKNKVDYLIQPDLFKRFSHHYQLRLLKKTNRYQACSTNVLGSHLNLVDGRSFYYMYKEIFKNEIYAFICDNNKPVIIDGGSNIGLSVIYFKMKYPQSEIIAFEADPKVFNILKSNIESFGYHNICLHQKALWDCETFLNFAVEGADSGRISDSLDSVRQEQVAVKTARLYDYLDREIDLLKLDIEGAEHQVLPDCASRLSNVKHIFVEYHSFSHEQQQLDLIISILAEAGFRIQIHTPFCASQPFIQRPLQVGMDLQLNIFGFREF